PPGGNCAHSAHNLPATGPTPPAVANAGNVPGTQPAGAQRRGADGGRAGLPVPVTIEPSSTWWRTGPGAYSAKKAGGAGPGGQRAAGTNSARRGMMRPFRSPVAPGRPVIPKNP